MINSDVAKLSYVIQRGVTTYPISFKFHFNENNSPQLLIKIGEDVATINVDYTLSDDNLFITLIPTEAEAAGLSGPNDYSWMDRIADKELLIQRDVPFVQASDYTVGRISPEQIEYDFDQSVMRDQQLAEDLEGYTVDLALAESLANAAVETANEASSVANLATETATAARSIAESAIGTADEAKAIAEQASIDAVAAMADAASAEQKASSAITASFQAASTAEEAYNTAKTAAASVANKQDMLTAGTNITIVDNKISANVYSKTQIDNKFSTTNAAIDANAVAIQKTRSDFMSADTEIAQLVNYNSIELNTLHNDVDELGDQVAGIESKIPSDATSKNQLVTKKDLENIDVDLTVYATTSYVDRKEQEIRADVNEGLSEIQTQVTAQASEITNKASKESVDGLTEVVNNNATVVMQLQTEVLQNKNSFTTKDLTVGTDEGTFNVGITAGVATIATNNGLDIAAQTKFDTAPTTDDSTAWSDVNPTALVTKQQVVSAIGSSGSGEYLPLSGGTITGKLIVDVGESPTTIGATKALGFTGTVDGVERTCWFSYIPQHYRLDVGNVNIYNAGNITPNGNGEKTIGSAYSKFNTIYTNQISSAASEEIIIPATSGTMARIEDIQAIGGDGTAGQVLTKTDDGMEWHDVTGGDYLPLSGGTMSGGIDWTTGPKLQAFSYGVRITPNKTNSTANYVFYEDCFRAFSDNGQDLGDPTSKWRTVYAYALSSKNGETLKIPTEGGTLARLEDLEGIGGGGASLPDQTGNEGKFLTTDGATASWGGGIIKKYQTSLGYNASTAGALYVAAFGANTSYGVTSNGATIIGHGAGVSNGKQWATAIGCGAFVDANCAIQLGSSGNYFTPYTNSDENTFKVGNKNGNFEMMSANGTIPTDRYTTTPTTAGTYVPKLTIAEDGTATREWGTESSGGGASGDYLPLTGGELTGLLTLNAETKTSASYYGAPILRLKAETEDGTTKLDHTISLTPGGILLANGLKINGLGDLKPKDEWQGLGDPLTPWGTVYAKKLRNGAVLNIPTEGGTLARIEDIDAAVGDISTALTAILGE